MDFRSALQTEIDDLEASLRASPDPRLVKLQELRRVRALYDGGASAPVLAAKSDTQDAKQGRSGRQPSPERLKAIEHARKYLSGCVGPVKTITILNRLQEEGVIVGGSSPVSNLSAMLHHSPAFQSHGRRGWTLRAPAEDEKPADLLSDRERSAGLSQPARDGEPVQEVEHDNMS